MAPAHVRSPLAVILVAVAFTACPRGDGPPPTDTGAVQAPPDVQVPPVEAPGDTAPRPAELAPTVPPATGAQRPQAPAQPQPRPPAGTPQPQTPATPAVTDTILGRATLVGAAPMMQLVLRRQGQPDVMLHGDASIGRGLRSVQGLDIEVTGQRTGTNELRVAQFRVRASEGVPAIDGRLEQEGDHYVIVSADGRRHHVHHLPSRLRDQVGRRVWLAGSLEREPESFGVIDG